jgi:hypothetical protein
MWLPLGGGGLCGALAGYAVRAVAGGSLGEGDVKMAIEGAAAFVEAGGLQDPAPLPAADGDGADAAQFGGLGAGEELVHLGLPGMRKGPTVAVGPFVT